MWTTYWWNIYGEGSPLEGEEFFTELKTDDEQEHRKHAQSIFPGEMLNCLGRISEVEAEMIGLDTY
jgi:hypothetical protein